jgi:hypothetical protein
MLDVETSAATSYNQLVLKAHAQSAALHVGAGRIVVPGSAQNMTSFNRSVDRGCSEPSKAHEQGEGNMKELHRSRWYCKRCRKQRCCRRWYYGSKFG